MIKSEAIKILHEVEKHQGFVIFIQCFRWKLKCTEEETCIECESKTRADKNKNLTFQLDRQLELFLLDTN